MNFSTKPMSIYFVMFENEVVYIGQTRLSLETRKKQHEYNSKRGKGFIIGAAIRKHGSENFTWNVHSLYYNQVDLDAAEKHFIAKYKPKYNINLGGEARGVRKASGVPAWNKGKVGSQIAWNKGRKETRPEVLANIKNSAASRDSSNHTIGIEQREAMVKGRRAAYEKTQTPFKCDQNGKTYILVVDAAADLGIKPHGIYAVLNPKHPMKSFKGFTFSYIQTVRAV